MITSLRQRILLPTLLIVIATTLGLTLYLSAQVRQTRRADLQERLLAEARLLAGELSAAWPADMDALAQRVSASSGERVTLVGVDGVVLGESHLDRTTMENHLYRAEIWQALQTGSGVAIRSSPSLGQEWMYVAARAGSADQPRGVVRMALPLTAIEAHINRLSVTILVAGAVTLLLAAGMAVYSAERTARPLRQLTEAAQRMASGDLSAHLLPVTHDEIGQLIRAFNDMADKLRAQMDALTDERARLAVVLHTMADGVIITDALGRVQLLNPAAARILQIEATPAIGRSFAQVVYDHPLVEVWQRCQQTGQEQAQVVESNLRGAFWRVVITPLLDVTPPRILVILQDLTHVRQLETVRRDFISNLSHELRTPLASLGVVVETLREGAIDDPPQAHRFLAYMETELTALTQMVEELLELARIESGRVPLVIQTVAVDALLEPPVERLRPQAERQGVTLHADWPADLPPVLADAERIQRVIMNLLHNAIKFTPQGGAIHVSATAQETTVVIAVQDTGAGIPSADLPRIFERFYKTDKARSGGGTGLGLSIARHIVQGHQGRIWVESQVGAGSTFYFSLPRADCT